MASTLETDIIRVLTDTRDQIRANMQARNISASGRTSESIRVEPYDGGVRLIGGYNATRTVDGYTAGTTAPVPTLEIGRAGGSVPKGFYHIIREWTREKRLTFASERERNTFAYFVARNIARQGTQRHASPVDVYSTPVTQAVGKLREVMSSGMRNTIRAAIGGGTVRNIKTNF